MLKHRYNDQHVCVGCGVIEQQAGDTKCPGTLQPPFEANGIYKLRVWTRDRDEEPRLYDVQVLNGKQALKLWRRQRSLGNQVNYEEADENTRRRFRVSSKPSH